MTSNANDDRKLRAIDAMDAMLRGEAEATIRCAQCGEDNPFGAEVCTFCGVDLAATADAPPGEAAPGDLPAAEGGADASAAGGPPPLPGGSPPAGRIGMQAFAQAAANAQKTKQRVQNPFESTAAPLLRIALPTMPTLAGLMLFFSLWFLALLGGANIPGSRSLAAHWATLFLCLALVFAVLLMVGWYYLYQESKRFARSKAKKNGR